MTERRKAVAITSGMHVLLIGAGGHARSVWAALCSRGVTIHGYTERQAIGWLDAPWLGDDTALDEQRPQTLCIGLGGMSPDVLARRRAIVEKLARAGHELPVVVDRSAILAPDVDTGIASQILAGAVVQAAARLGLGCIVNSRAVVEHEAVLGDGVHVAPGAIVLGGCRIGEDCMIGAGAVILPGAEVPPGTLVPSLTRWPRRQARGSLPGP